MSSRRMARTNETNTRAVRYGSAVPHVTDYGLMNLWTIPASSPRARGSLSSVFVRFFVRFFIYPQAGARVFDAEVGRGRRKREETQNVIYTWNEKAVPIVQTTPVISDYDN